MTKSEKESTFHTNETPSEPSFEIPQEVLDALSKTTPINQAINRELELKRKPFEQALKPFIDAQRPFLREIEKFKQPFHF